SELFLVHRRRRLICVHVRLARARPCSGLISVYLLSATLHARLSAYVRVCLSTYIRAALRLRLLVALLLRGTHFLPLRWCSSLRVFRLALCCGLLLVRSCLAERQQR